MICSETIRLAKRGDAVRIAELSRDIIEFGLGWSWTPLRVLKQMHAKNTNVSVVTNFH